MTFTPHAQAQTVPVIVLPTAPKTQVSELQAKQINTAQLSELAKLAIKESTGIKNSPKVDILVKNNTTVLPTLLGSEAEQPCTDCDGSNPCEDCEGHAPGTPQLKDTSYVSINLPNQGDPTAAQKEETEKSKRKTMVVYGCIALAVLIALIFIVKQFKKGK